MNASEFLSLSSESSVVKGGEKEGHVHSTANRHRALDDGYGLSSRIDPLSNSISNSFSGFPYLRREGRTAIPISDQTHHDRQLEAIEIETTHDGRIGSKGVMFDIRTKTKAKVRIRSLMFLSRSADDNCDVSVFTKRGTHRSFEENSAAWINIVDTTMECKGPGTATAITSSMFDSSLTDELIIEPDIGRAIYIQSNNVLRYSLTDAEDKVFAEDSYVQIFEGTGLTQDFANLHSPRMWNGLLTYELVASAPPPQLPGCVGILATPSNDSSQSFGHMFNIGSNYPGGILIDGIEFQTHKTTKLNYEIYTIATTFMNNIGNSEWTLVAKGSVIGAGEGAVTAVDGSNFTPVSIEEKTTRGFYITLDTQDLRYAESSGKMGEIFVQNDHISMEVGVGVAEYPMGKKFYPNRQWCGRVLYRTVNECPLPISVDYMYDVQYSKELRDDHVLLQFSKIVNSFVENFLKTNAEVKFLEQESGNSISLLSTETVINGGFSSSCASTNDSDICNTLVSTVTVGNLSAPDTGYIKFLLVQQNQAVSSVIGGIFAAKYVGDEPIDTEIQLVLQGVNSSTMGSVESAYLEEIITIFLNKKINLSGVEILTVRVIKVSIPPIRLLIEKERVIDPARIITDMNDESYDAVFDIIISGKHRPPPDIDFDSRVKDAINFNEDELKYDLASNSAYFQDIQQISTLLPDPVVPPSLLDPLVDTPPSLLGPSPTPSQKPITNGNDNDSGTIVIGIIVALSVAIMTLGLIFGTYMMYDAARNKRRAREQPEEETPNMLVEPMVGNWSLDLDDSAFAKKCVADRKLYDEISRMSSSTMSTFSKSSMHPRDNERGYQTLSAMRDTQNCVIGEEKSYAEDSTYDHEITSHKYILANGRSSIRTDSPSSRRTKSPSGHLKASFRRTHSPSCTSRSLFSLDRSSISSRRTNSPALDTLSLNAEHSDGSVYTNHSAPSSKDTRKRTQSMDTGFSSLFGSGIEDEESAEIPRLSTGIPTNMNTIPNIKNLINDGTSSRTEPDGSSKKDKTAYISSSESFSNGSSGNSTISTKELRIPGKRYY